MEIVIVGAGIAAFNLVQALRRINTTVRITVITACSGDQYYKPNLSQALSCNIDPSSLVSIAAKDWCKKYDVCLFPNAFVRSVDSEKHIVAMADQDIYYDKLVLATGAKPLPMPCEGFDANEIPHVNSLASYLQFRTALTRSDEVTIIGAGLVGCELASDLANKGYKATLIFPQNEPLMKLFPEELCRFIRYKLRDSGVKFVSGKKVISIQKNSNSIADDKIRKILTLSDNSTVSAGLVVNCAGLIASSDLAQQSLLAVRNGIVTDEFLQTTNEHIYAIGDCAEINGVLHQYVPPIIQSAKALASTILGQPKAYIARPYPVDVKIQQVPLNFMYAGKVEEWELQGIDEGMIAKGLDDKGNLVAYALAGRALKQRSGLVSELLKQPMAV